MKKIFLIVVILVISIMTISCNNDENENINNPQNNLPELLVSKVYNNNRELIGNYIYDSLYRLVKYEYTDSTNNNNIDYSFFYGLNNCVERIEVRHINHPGFNNNIYYCYHGNSKRIYEYNQKLTSNNINITNSHIYYNFNGTIDSVIENTEDIIYHNLYYYNYYQNCIQTIVSYEIGEDNDSSIVIKKLITGTQNRTYDSKKKPSFGLDYLIGINLLPWFYNLSNIEYPISRNNIIKELDNAYEYSYEYNDKGYPIKIIQTFQDYTNPIELNIEYIKPKPI